MWDQSKVDEIRRPCVRGKASRQLAGLRTCSAQCTGDPRPVPARVWGLFPHLAELSPCLVLEHSQRATPQAVLLAQSP